MPCVNALSQTSPTHLTVEGLTLSASYQPASGRDLIVLAHGAGAGCEHPHMLAISSALAAVDISSLRFNFPFIEKGHRRVDKKEICLAALDAAIEQAQQLAPDARLILGGHSFGGRMGTHLMAERPRTEVKAVVLFSFPLHPADKPAVTRAAHLPEIKVPMLFLSGDRDKLAERGLMQKTVGDYPEARLHWLETADHSYNILKRTRVSTEDIYAEAARVTRQWLDTLV